MDSNYEIARARNPKWVDELHNMIDLEVDFVPIDEEWLPYTCSPFDVVKHSRDLYRRAVAGEFGQIADEDTLTDEDRWTPVTTEEVDVSKEALVQILLEKGVLTDEEVDSIILTTQKVVSYARPTKDGSTVEWAGS